MNDKFKTKSLLPSEVEARVDSVGPNSFTLVVYVNPRTAMNVLDETFGEDKWSKTVSVNRSSPDSPFYAVCRIEIMLDDGRVIAREDVGEDPRSPKNAASDSIKRAVMNFVPSLRALYTIPTLRVKPEKLGIRVSGSSPEERKKEISSAIRFKKFAVSSISFGTGAKGEFVQTLQIVEEESGEVVCEYISKQVSLYKERSPELLKLEADIAEAGLTEEQVLSRYAQDFGANTLEDVVASENMLAEVYRRIERHKEKHAKARADGSRKSNSVNERLKGEKEAS